MPATGSALRFFVDESALGLAKALEIARHDVVHSGHRLVPEAPLGALDTEWLPLVAERSLIVIARDRRIRTKPAEVALLRQHGVRVFWIAGKRDLSTWEYLVRVVRWWEAIEETILTAGPGPWFYAINENGLVELRL